MWIFLSNAFLSVVADEKHPDVLVVRARADGDLERAFPGRRLKVTKTPSRDYMYRTFLPRGVVADCLRSAALNITATNFKASVKDEARHSAYLKVWTAMAGYQERLHAKPRRFEPEFDFGGGFKSEVCGECGGSGTIRRGAHYHGTCGRCHGSGYEPL